MNVMKKRPFCRSRDSIFGDETAVIEWHSFSYEHFECLDTAIKNNDIFGGIPNTIALQIVQVLQHFRIAINIKYASLMLT